MYLIDVYRDPYAGTENQLYKLIEGLDKNKFSPALTLFRTSAYINDNGFPCDVQSLGIYRLLSLVSLYKLLRFAMHLRRENYRIVHIFFNDASIIAPIILKLAGLKVLISRRDMGYWYTRTTLIILRINRFFIDGAIVNSNAVRDLTHDREKIPLERIHTIYNGYDFKNTETGNHQNPVENSGSNTRVIGLVANIRPIKRIDILIRAFEIVHGKHPDTALVIVGDGEPGGLQQLARELGIDKSVNFTGKKTNSREIIKRFDVGVLCSESEGFSNTIIEYMHAGIPVVATDTGGNPELVRDGVTGFLVPVGDHRALAEKICKILAGLPDRDKLVDNARRKIRDICSMEKMISSHVQLYQSL